MIKENNSNIEKENDQLHNFIIESIQDIKGEKIIKIDLRELDGAPTDFFIICEGDNMTKVRAIAEHIKLNVKTELGIHPSNLEGTVNGNWMVVDYFTTVVHVFYAETRALYNLENLWGDAKFEEIPEITEKD